MRTDIERRIKRLELHFASKPLEYRVTLMCMCGWELLGGEHVCRPNPPPPRPGVIVLDLDKL